MISVRRFVALEKTARAAMKAGDQATIDLINTDPEIISANVLLFEKNGELYCGVRSEMLAGSDAEKGAAES